MPGNWHPVDPRKHRMTATTGGYHQYIGFFEGIGWATEAILAHQDLIDQMRREHAGHEGPCAGCDALREFDRTNR